MTTQPDPAPVSVVLVDPHFWEASGPFNPNAFPDHVKADAHACMDRLAILTHSVSLVLREPGLERSVMLKRMRDDPVFRGFVPQPDKPAVIIFHNLNFLAGVYATLISLKSLLDVHARLISRLLVPSSSVFGFNSGHFKGRRLSGGRLLQWLDRSAPKGFAGREELISVLLGHVEAWIDEAVVYRDAVVHDGFIPKLTEARLSFRAPVQDLVEEEIKLPAMPNGQLVTTYCSGLSQRVRQLVNETLRLLPGLEVSLLSLGDDHRDDAG